MLECSKFLRSRNLVGRGQLYTRRKLLISDALVMLGVSCCPQSCPRLQFVRFVATHLRRGYIAVIENQDEVMARPVPASAPLPNGRSFLVADGVTSLPSLETWVGSEQ